MKYNLVYPTEKIKEIDIKVFKGSIHELSSDVDIVNSGTIITAILQDITDQKEEDLKHISLIDARQIIGLAWKQTYDATEYQQEVLCECGKRHIFNHEIIYDIKPDDKFLNPQEIDGMKVVLQSPTVKREVAILKCIQDDEKNTYKFINLAWNDLVLSINDKQIPYKDLSLGFIHKCKDILTQEQQSIKDMSTKTHTCTCKKEVVSTLNMMETDFLSPKNFG